MEQLNTIIMQHPLLQTMRPDHLKALTDCAIETAFESGEVLFREGEIADRFYLLMSGKVVLESRADSEHLVPIQVLEKGDALGWSWLFPPFVWHFQARALERARAVAFNGAHLLIACEKDHEFGYELMKRISQILIQRLQSTRKQLLQIRTKAEPAGGS
jgi:CRP/FNR family transcriptional regulator, cyclic AMP receptor protein